MRRLIAHIALCATALAAVGTTFAVAMTRLDYNNEYSDGVELSFRVGDENDSENVTIDTTKTPAEQISDIMKDRLDDSNITSYKIVTEGEDTVKVSFNDSDVDVDNIKTYLTFNGNIALTTSEDDYAYLSDFLDDDAYLDSVNGYPTISVPIDNTNENYKTLLEKARQYKEDGVGGETSTDSEGEETSTYYLYMWYDFEEGDTSLYESDSNIAKKRFLQFNIDDIEDDSDELVAVVNIQSSSVSAISNAYDTARYYVNLVNASELPYEVEFMYQSDVIVSPTVESLIYRGSVNSSVALSATFYATIFAIVIVGLVLCAYFRLGALSVGTIAITSVFAGILGVLLTSAELNTFGILGLIAVGVTSLASGIIYLSKLKDECYKGRTLKKANADASKHSTLPIVDVNIALIAIGAFVYLFCYVYDVAFMRSFCAITVIGGLVSLLLNTLGMKGLMWLLTNATSLQGKYEIFGITRDKVPNAAEEEKQSYFGAYEKKDLTSKKKPVAIVAAVLFVASVAGMIAFGVTNDGNFFNTTTKTLTSEIYIETETTNTALTDTYVEEILGNIYTYSKSDKSDAVAVSSYTDEIYTYTNTRDYREEGEGTETYSVTTTYFLVTLNNKISGDTNAYANVSGVIDMDDTLNTVLSSYLSADGRDDAATADVKTSTVLYSSEPSWAPIMLGTFVGVAALSVYFMLRYRLSRGITSLLITTGTCGIATGIAVLTRISVSTYVMTALPIIAIFTTIISVIFMNRERELVIEDKAHDKTPAHREEISKRAIALAFDCIGIVAITGIYLGVNFAGFGASATISIYIMLTLGCLIGLALVAILYAPLSQVFYKWFYKIGESFRNNREEEKKKAAHNNIRHKSGEPEEAIFIGIND